MAPRGGRSRPHIDAGRLVPLPGFTVSDAGRINAYIAAGSTLTVEQTTEFVARLRGALTDAPLATTDRMAERERWTDTT